jgi:hypothetical protein
MQSRIWKIESLLVIIISPLVWCLDVLLIKYRTVQCKPNINNFNVSLFSSYATYNCLYLFLLFIRVQHAKGGNFFFFKLAIQMQYSGFSTTTLYAKLTCRGLRKTRRKISRCTLFCSKFITGIVLLTTYCTGHTVR